MPDNGPYDSHVDRWKQEIIDARTGHEWSFYNGTAEEDCPHVVARIRELEWMLIARSGER